MAETMTPLHAYSLFHDGLLSLIDVKQNGLRLDINHVQKEIKKRTNQQNKLKDKFLKSKVGKLWKKHYPNQDFPTNDHLVHVLFRIMKLKPPKKTKKGNIAIDEEVLTILKGKIPALGLIIKIRKIGKMVDTYFSNLMDEQYDGNLHPNFWLHIPVSYRSSSSDPNLQNQPKHDEMLFKAVRRAFIPSPGNLLMEADYGSMEVRISASIHRDPVMMNYIKDKSKDMHRDMAMECFKIGPKRWKKIPSKYAKAIRYVAKNNFVFAEFYGSYYKQIAPNLWEAIDSMDLRIRKDVSLRNHLNRLGLSRYEDFERHIKKVEDNMWKNRFKVYGEWREKHVQKYKDNGYFDLVTGFRCHGVFSRNKLFNYPIQGPAFHCLLWSMIRINDILKTQRWKSKIITEVHDSLLFDVHPKEYDGLIKLVKRVMSKDIREAWKWIAVPLEVDIEVGLSWDDMNEVILQPKCSECGTKYQYKHSKECPVCKMAA